MAMTADLVAVFNQRKLHHIDDSQHELEEGTQCSAVVESEISDKEKREVSLSLRRSVVSKLNWSQQFQKNSLSKLGFGK